MAMDTPMLSQLGNDIGIGVFAVAIGGLVDFMARKDAWTPEIVKESAAIAYNEYCWFTIAELKLFTIKVKAGHYNSQKNFIAPVMMEMLLEFAREIKIAKRQLHEQARKEALRNTKAIESPPVPPEQVQQLLKDFFKLIEEAKQRHEQEAQEYRQQRKNNFKNQTK